MFFILHNDELILNIEYVLSYPKFKAVYDQFVKRDILDNVFRYIYEVSDLRSYANRRNYDDDMKHEYAIRKAKLEEDFKVTKVVKEAIMFYIQNDYSAESTLLRDLKDTLALSIKTNQRIKKVLEKILDNDDTDDKDALAVIDYQKKLFDIINELPKQIQQVKQLEVKVHEQITKPKIIGRGGEQIRASYDGDPRIEG